MIRLLLWSLVWIMSLQFVHSNEVVLQASREFFARRRDIFRDPLVECLKFKQMESLGDNKQVCQSHLSHRVASKWVRGCPEKGFGEPFPRYWHFKLTCQFPFLFFRSRQLQWGHLLLE